MDTIDISMSEEIYTISRLNREARNLLEGTFPMVWVEGEISNFTVPNSGHWYFSLKDEVAQVRCAMFRAQNRRLTFTPKEGTHVFAKARVSLYEGRGDFQLLIEHLEEAGVGKLQKEFEALKKKLLAAGLFDEAHKKPFPHIPKQIGVITSPTGAAIRDILSVLKRRFACVPILIYPTLVQGETAPPTIVKQIEIANARKECDVIILARGGGSLEDLWCFNDERVAHAIFKSEIPIITGIGHEIDFTIADFVADRRAPTPSAAAELIAPDCSELMLSLDKHKNHFYRTMQQKLQTLQHQLSFAKNHLNQQHPKRKLTEQQQKLDQLELNLQNLIRGKLQVKQQSLARLAGILDALSPLSVLKRGFSITSSLREKKIISNANEVAVGEKIQVLLSEGKLDCTVDGVS